MLVRVFSINKFKSDCIKSDEVDLAIDPPNWTNECIHRQVTNNKDVVGTDYGSEFAWTSYIDEKYVRS